MNPTQSHEDALEAFIANPNSLTWNKLVDAFRVGRISQYCMLSESGRCFLGCPFWAMLNTNEFCPRIGINYLTLTSYTALSQAKLVLACIEALAYIRVKPHNKDRVREGWEDATQK